MMRMEIKLFTVGYRLDTESQSFVYTYKTENIPMMRMEIKLLP
jgi:hypothetical protein